MKDEPYNTIRPLFMPNSVTQSVLANHSVTMWLNERRFLQAEAAIVDGGLARSLVHTVGNACYW